MILTILYCHIDFSNVHECILTATYCAVFVLLLMHVLLWLSLLSLLYIVRNDENKGDQSIIIPIQCDNLYTQSTMNILCYIWSEHMVSFEHKIEWPVMGDPSRLCAITTT